MNLIDFHCDTIKAVYERNQSLYDGNLHISLKKAEVFEKYAQVCAVFSDKSLGDDECYDKFFKIVENLKKDYSITAKKAKIITNGNDIEPLWQENIVPIILTVEDARLLANDISRLDVLYQNGIRILTLNWSGDTCIGSAHDSKGGLTPFGKEVLNKCFELGIIPDISHASREVTSEVIAKAKELNKPIIASHSDSYAISTHTRNLLDSEYRDIISLGGIAGLNLCPYHLNINGNPTIDDIVKHAEHYLSIGGENNLTMGLDLDGTSLPSEIKDIGDIILVSNRFVKEFGKDITEKIMYKNALAFMKKNIK